MQIALCLLAVTLLSGLYPAVFLSRYNITKVLKGDYSTGKKGIAFRNALIVVQFTVSAFFIISTMVISNQMRFMQTKDKGFSGEQVMRLEAPQNVRDDILMLHEMHCYLFPVCNTFPKQLPFPVMQE